MTGDEVHARRDDLLADDPTLYDRGSDVPGWLDPIPTSDPRAHIYRLDARVKELFR